MYKGVNRCIATFTAGALAIALHWIANKSGETMEPIVRNTSLFILASAATFSRFIPTIKRWFDCGITRFILTFSLVAVSGYRVQKLVELDEQTTSTIIIGISICLLVAILIFPVWVGNDLHLPITCNMDKLADSLEGSQPFRTCERNLLKSSEKEKPSFSFRTTDKPTEVEAPVNSQSEKVCSVLQSNNNPSNATSFHSSENEVEPQLMNILENFVLTLDSVGKQKLETNSLEPERNIIRPKKRKLLVLDINGLLADIFIDIHHLHRGRKKVGGRVVFKRPFCDDFMKFCFERFAVGIWSSRRKNNVDKVINYIFGENSQKLLFCWDQDHCMNTGFRTLENVHKPLVLKELKKLWNKEDKDLPWVKGDFSPSNTLLVDDSPYKALSNPAFTAIFPNPYQCGNENDTSLGPGGDLRLYLEGLYEADDVQLYVQKHPFGQQPITSNDSSWSFYSQVIKKLHRW